MKAKAGSLGDVCVCVRERECVRVCMFVMAANDCDICQEGRLEGVKRGAEKGMHAELFYDSADSPLAIFTSASCTINNPEPTASFQSPHQYGTFVKTVR